jgi:Domain of unknown function (DUF5916)/Carbohydrate family 9 binding domain-like
MRPHDPGMSSVDPRRRPFVLSLFLVLSVIAAAPLRAQQGPESPLPSKAVGTREAPPRKTLEVRRAKGPLKIDGVLDEEAWAEASVLELPYEIFPGDSTPAPVKTECRVTFDDKNLYLGFHAFDPRPSEIRAHLADRDEITTFQQDDHVGFQIDAFNDERRAFQFRVNPLGVQADALFSELDGIEDWAWDAIWTSAGRVTNDGYVVEVAIPFNQIRFPRSESALVWGFDVFRSYPRDVRYRISASYNDLNRSCLLCQANKMGGLVGIHSGRNLELDPTATAHRRDARPDFPAGSLERDRQKGELGLTARFGVTPNLTLNAAVNPDFSQVEADVAQLDVNTRFALFYEEKRPFFLEGSDFFATPLQAVYTRTVADPQGGVKATGKFGRNGLGVFVARDDVTNLLLPANQTSDLVSLDQKVWSGVLRYRRDVGNASSLGFIYAGREGDGYHNHLVGADAFWRASNTDTLRFQYSRSDTLYPQSVVAANRQPAGPLRDDGLFADYNHQSQKFSWLASYQSLGPGYRADSGFIPRVDVRTLEGNFGRILRGDAKRWFSQINIQAVGQRTEDHGGRLTDQKVGAEVIYSGSKQTMLDVTVSASKTYLKGVTYDLKQVDALGEIRPTGDLRINFTGTFGDALDFANGRKGSGQKLGPALQYRLGRHLDLRLSHNLERVAVEAGRVFRANLTQGRIAYYLGTRAFARVILQYLNLDQDPALYATPVDAKTRHLFSQVLFSYKVNPQTVAFLGYSDNAQAVGSLALTRADRTFFVKLGYAWAP